MNFKRYGKLKAVLYIAYRLHLYSSAGEAWFKTICITLAYCGAFLKDTSVGELFLFALSIVMEYMMNLVASDYSEDMTLDFVLPKLCPALLVVMNLIVVFTVLGSALFLKEDIVYQSQMVVEAFTLLIVWIDVFSTTFIKEPKENNPENRLKKARSVNV